MLLLVNRQIKQEYTDVVFQKCQLLTQFFASTTSAISLKSRCSRNRVPENVRSRVNSWELQVIFWENEDTQADKGLALSFQRNLNGILQLLPELRRFTLRLIYAQAEDVYNNDPWFANFENQCVFGFQPENLANIQTLRKISTIGMDYDDFPIYASVLERRYRLDVLEKTTRTLKEDRSKSFSRDRRFW